jgi:hypothetical protein
MEAKEAKQKETFWDINDKLDFKADAIAQVMSRGLHRPNSQLKP